MLTPIFLTCTSIPDAWYQSLYKCIEIGNNFKIDQGSYAGQERREFDYITVRIKYPWVLPLLPDISQYNIPNPVASDYLDEYLPYLMTGKLKEGESYTYGQRLSECSLKNGQSTRWLQKAMLNILIQDKEVWENPNIIKNEHGKIFINQIELLIWTYKNKGYRNNQMCLQVAKPDDMLLQDPPCLRHIDTRIQDGKLHFFPYFRSWDLWGGFPANLAAIELLKQYVASEIGVENGEIIASSKGLHLYNYVWELAGIIRGKTITEFKGNK